jgi:hypothetical protein
MKRRSFIATLGVALLAPHKLLNLCEEPAKVVTPSQAIFDALTSGDKRMTEEAVAAINEFTRVKVREESPFLRLVQTADTVHNRMVSCGLLEEAEVALLPPTGVPAGW